MKKIMLVLAVCLTATQLIAQKEAKQVPPPQPPPIEVLAPPPPPPPPPLPPAEPEKLGEIKILNENPVSPPPPPPPPKAPKAPKAPEAAAKFTPAVIVKDSN